MIKSHILGRELLTLSKCLHIVSTECSFFSVTRARLGKTDAELDKETNLPEPKELVIYNCRRNIDARPRKLNLLAKQIRYLPLSEAIKQMEFSAKQAAKSIKEVLEETQEKAQAEHSVADVSTLWVAESYVGRGFIEKKMIRHGRGRFGAGRKAFTHYFLVVKEGLPKPKQQRRSNEDKTHRQQYAEYQPKIVNSLAWW